MGLAWKNKLAAIAALAGVVSGRRAYGGPPHATIGLTNKCNIICAHCYYYSPKIDDPNTIQTRLSRLDINQERKETGLKEFREKQADEEQVYKVMKELIDMGTRRFQFAGGGEPFTHPDILEIMAYAKRKGAWCSVNTNGTLLSGRTCDRLTEMGFDELKVTVMAGTEEDWIATHPGMKGSLFSDLTKGLIHIADRKKKLGKKNPHVSVVFVITSLNCEGILDFAEYAKKVAADEVIFRMIDDVGDEGLACQTLSEEHIRLVERQLEETKHILDLACIPHNIGNITQVLNYKLDTTAFHDIVPCYYGWLAMRIEINGNVYPCCRCYSSLGNVYDSSVREVWHGEEYIKFREKAITLNKTKTPLPNCDCHSCVHHNANLKVFRLLHPIRGHSKQIKDLSPSAGKDSDGA